jgi:spermidine/putrescine transport system permease protein
MWAFMSDKGILKVITILFYAFIFIPVIIVATMSFHPSSIPTFPPPSLSLKWYWDMVTNIKYLRAIQNSIIVALVSSVLSGIIGMVTSIGLVRYWFKGREILIAIALLPLILPPVIMGATVLMFLTTLGLPLREYSMLYLIFGHTLFCLPYVIIIVHSRLYGLDKSLEEAAMNLGANEFQTFKEIILPQIAPAVISGMLFAFAMSLDDYAATIFWVVPETETIPVRIFSALRTEFPPTINALGTTMILVMFFIFQVRMWLQKK